MGTRTTNRLDDEMCTILQRTDLCEDNTIKLYSSVMQMFLRLTRQMSLKTELTN